MSHESRPKEPSRRRDPLLADEFFASSASRLSSTVRAAPLSLADILAARFASTVAQEPTNVSFDALRPLKAMHC